jgi:hypothetical protein
MTMASVPKHSQTTIQGLIRSDDFNFAAPEKVSGRRTG